MVHYTEFGYETDKYTQLAWNFGQLDFKKKNKIVAKTKKKVKRFTQLFLNFETSWLHDELKKAVFADDIVAFYRKHSENRNFQFLFFPKVRTFVCEFFARILTSDFELNFDGSIRKNCAIKKAQKVVNNNDVNALLNMIDSHARLHSRGEQIAFKSLKYQAKDVVEDEESVEEKLKKIEKSKIVMGLKKLYAEGMCERELRELCETIGVDYNGIAQVRMHVQTTLDVA